MIINMTGGGANAFARIAVSYPAGSVCTCTNGTKTLTAKNTSGGWTFSVPATGTWTVSCTDEDRTASRSVTISAKGETKLVTLSYGELYLSGNEFTSLTGGWTGNGTKGTDYIEIVSGVNPEQHKEMHTANLIDVTEFSTATLTGTVTKGGTYDSVKLNIGSASLNLSNASTTQTLDISSVTGAVNVSIESQLTSVAAALRMFSLVLS